MGIADLAGIAATLLFATSHLPMLAKAVRTHDVRSYSVGNLLLVNVGNVTYTLYVLSLPIGPIWVLHLFYLVTAGIMLTLVVRARGLRRRGDSPARPAAGPVVDRGSREQAALP